MKEKPRRIGAGLSRRGWVGGAGVGSPPLTRLVNVRRYLSFLIFSLGKSSGNSTDSSPRSDRTGLHPVPKTPS
jgi:hypothetical protein